MGDSETEYLPDVPADGEKARKRPPYLRNVIIVVLLVSVAALTFLLVRSVTGQDHDVASVPDEEVLGDTTLLTRAQRAVDRFRARGISIVRQLDLIAARTDDGPTDAELADLADQLNRLVLLRCAVTGTGAQLEERMARNGPDGGLLTDTTTAYSRFAHDFDKAVVEVFSGETSIAVAAGTAEVLPMSIEGFVPEARAWLESALSDAADVREQLERVAERM